MQFQHMEADVEAMNPGERLGLALDTLRLTQARLAKECDVTPQYVNNILRRGQRITEDFAIAVGRSLGINLNWLFLGEGPMMSEEYEERSKAHSRTTGEAEALLREAANNLYRAADIL
jgi:plasmid maintenance system antidote protein VapI